MIYLTLFLVFLEIGAVSFGGGYAMIPLIRDKVISLGWLTEEELLNIIAVAESTPGPIAVNMATFVGSTQGGILGSLLATLGVVLPSFLIIILISAVMSKFLEYKGVSAFLGGVRPCVIALIIGTAINLFSNQLLRLSVQPIGSISPDVKGIFILAVLFIISAVYKKIKGKKPSPIAMIGISALLGIILYSFIGG